MPIAVVQCRLPLSNARRKRSPANARFTTDRQATLVLPCQTPAPLGRCFKKTLAAPCITDTSIVRRQKNGFQRSTGGIKLSCPALSLSVTTTSAEMEMRGTVVILGAVLCSVLDGKMIISSSSGSI